MSVRRRVPARASGPTFPCARCRRPLRRTTATRPRRITCPRCRFLIFDYPRSCSGMLVLRGDRLLVLRRGHAPKRGFLDIPGGFMEAGESFERAARRELREETGLTVGRVERLGIYWDRYFLKGFGFFPTLNVYYLARWRSGEAVAADDAAGAEWVPVAGLGRTRARPAWAHMREVFRDLRRRLARGR
jgi:8-oxo-dGTP diphosphatase